VRKSERWVRRRYADVVHFDEPDRGGHFGALEHPQAFVAGVRETFRSLR
jgi:microsomal epoxide hydrolase